MLQIPIITSRRAFKVWKRLCSCGVCGFTVVLLNVFKGLERFTEAGLEVKHAAENML